MDRPKVLIVRFSSLGDVVLATSAAQYLKAQGDVEVFFATKSAFAPLLRGQACIDEVWKLEDFGLRGLAREARQRGITAILDLHGNLRSRALGWMSRLPVTRWEAGTLNRRLRVQFPSFKVAELEPVCDRYARAAAAVLGLEAKRFLPRLTVEPTSAAWAKQWLQEHGYNGEPLLAVAPGAAWASKRWDVAQLAQALNMLEGVQVLLVGSASEEPLCRDVEALLERPAFVAAGKTADLRHLLALIAASKAFLGHDSGPMHLAEALGVPSTVLFGPTVEEFGFYPQGPGHHVFQVDLNCRPCSVHGTERCPLGHHHCMKMIAPADVSAHLAQVLKA